MLYNKNNLIISDIINEKSTKHDLTNVYFNGNKTVATDSYILLEVTNPGTMYQNEDFPVIGEDKKAVNVIKTVPAKTVKKVLQNIPKSKEMPILEHVIFLESDENIAKLATTDLENNQIMVAKNGKNFPEYTRIIPKPEGFVSVDIDVELLSKLINTIKKMDLPADGRITLSIKDNITPATIHAKTIQYQEVLGLIMPLK